MEVWIVCNVGLDDDSITDARAYSTKALADTAAQLHGAAIVAGPIGMDADVDRVRAGLGRYRVTAKQSDGDCVSCEHLGIGTGDPTMIVVDNCYGFIVVTVDATDPEDAEKIAAQIQSENAKATTRTDDMRITGWSSAGSIPPAHAPHSRPAPR